MKHTVSHNLTFFNGAFSYDTIFQAMKYSQEQGALYLGVIENWEAYSHFEEATKGDIPLSPREHIVTLIKTLNFIKFYDLDREVVLVTFNPYILDLLNKMIRVTTLVRDEVIALEKGIQSAGFGENNLEHYKLIKNDAYIVRNAFICMFCEIKAFYVDDGQANPVSNNGLLNFKSNKLVH